MRVATPFRSPVPASVETPDAPSLRVHETWKGNNVSFFSFSWVLFWVLGFLCPHVRNLLVVYSLQFRSGKF